MKKSFFIGIVMVSFATMQGYSDKYTESLINARLKSYDLSKNLEEVKPLLPQGFFNKIKNLFVAGKDFSVNEKSLPIKLQNSWDEFGINSSSVPVIQQEAIADLELLQGSFDSENSFISRMTNSFGNSDVRKYLVTTVGEKIFAEFIAMPAFDLSIINARQQSIKILLEDSLLREKFFSTLQKMKKHEPDVFDFFGKDGLDGSLKAISPADYNEYPYFNSAMSRTGDFARTPLGIMSIFNIMTITMGAGLVYGAYSYISEESKVMLKELGKLKDDDTRLSYTKRFAWANCKDTIKNIKENPKPYAYFYGLFLSPLWLYLMGGSKAHSDVVKSVQKKVIGFAQQVRTSKELLEKARDNNMVLNGIDEQISFLAGRDVASILQKKGLAASLIKKVEWLQGQLWSRTFNEGKPSYFSSPGHILLANKYLSDPEVRKVYKEAFEMVGEVDCYVALAKKMAAHKDKANAPFCFVDFIENSEKPFVDIKDFWNPFISDDVVVPNDLILNGTDGIRNLIITGPNTSGKSGNTKGLFLNLILAQSFGIAAAKECSMTMFRRIITYLNIADDTGNNLSLFKAAAKRANKVVRTLSSLPKNEFGVCLMDEPYVGTAHEAAVIAATENILSINALENCMLIVNTHLKEITELENSYHSIANYRIGAVINSETGRIEFTYKLEPGTSEISSAAQVVADVKDEDDFDDEE